MLREEEAIYQLGYRAGYQRALADYHIDPGDGQIPREVASLPLVSVGLSARAVNCLRTAGCMCVGDVCRLDEGRILRMRYLGPKTAAEIAALLLGYGIYHTAWTQFAAVGDEK